MHHVIKCTPKSSLRTKGEDDDAWSPCHVVDVAQRGERQDTPPKMFASNALGNDSDNPATVVVNAGETVIVE
jgi:hypothetical protein